MSNRERRREAGQIYKKSGSGGGRFDGRPASAALLCTLPFLAVPAAAFEADHHWSYSGASGPTHWSSLEPDYRVCGLGKAQSPIDIVTARVRARDLPALAFKYKFDAVRVVDNGHTIQVGVAGGSELRVGDDTYSLVQFHFHRPSEETIDGKPFPMDVHFVHADSAGRLAVVAVPIEAGAPNRTFDKLWANFRSKKQDQASAREVSINPAELLPALRGYYAYAGSLTTPPCSENVQWFILKRPVTLSGDQISNFAALYPNNARPVQPLNGRAVQSAR